MQKVSINQSFKLTNFSFLRFDKTFYTAPNDKIHFMKVKQLLKKF